MTAAGSACSTTTAAPPVAKTVAETEREKAASYAAWKHQMTMNPFEWHPDPKDKAMEYEWKIAGCVTSATKGAALDVVLNWEWTGRSRERLCPKARPPRAPLPMPTQDDKPAAKGDDKGNTELTGNVVSQPVSKPAEQIGGDDAADDCGASPLAIAAAAALARIVAADHATADVAAPSHVAAASAAAHPSAAALAATAAIAADAPRAEARSSSDASIVAEVDKIDSGLGPATGSPRPMAPPPPLPDYDRIRKRSRSRRGDKRRAREAAQEAAWAVDERHWHHGGYYQ